MDIKKVQIILLEMATVISKILDAHGVPYMISYGSLLGAVRHRGFIPWDADFDLMIFDEQYDRAVELLREELPDWLFVEDQHSEEKYFHAWAHVKDMNSVVHPWHNTQDSIYKHKGISLDLYRGYKIKRKDIPTFQYEQNELYLARRKKANTITDNEIEKKREKKIIENKELERLIKESGKNPDDYVLALLMFYKCKYLEMEDIYPLKKYEFEGHFFMGPNNAHNILSDIYGDYNKLPPVEERVSYIKEVDYF